VANVFLAKYSGNAPLISSASYARNVASNSGNAGKFTWQGTIATREVGDDRPVLVMAQEEGCFGRISRAKRCWAPPGVRPYVPAQVVREYIYAYTAVAPALGQMVSLLLPEASTSMMNLFLEQVSQTFSKYFIVMQVDQAGWHSAKDLAIPENIRLIPQPAYSPELNPVKSGPYSWQGRLEAASNVVERFFNIYNVGNGTMWNITESVKRRCRTFSRERSTTSFSLRCLHHRKPLRRSRLPVEHIWDELREKYFHNRIFSSLELLIDVLCQGLNALADDPERLRSLTGFPHLKVVI
jgi:hypothetical protein